MVKKFFIPIGIIVFILALTGAFFGWKYMSEKIATEKLIYTYNQIKKATDIYLKENNCENNIADCLSRAEGKNEWDYMNTEKYFEGIAKNLDIVDYACNNNYDKDWLSAKPAILLDGSIQTEAWEAPSKAFQDSYQSANCYYLFKNGAVMHVQFPDNRKQSGFGTLDINGKKAPNRIGKDIFPIGWGAAGNPKHWAAKGANPFWAEDGYATLEENNGDDYNFTDVQEGPQYRGLCRISCPKCDCKPDVHSPTYYVLENKKLPDIK